MNRRICFSPLGWLPHETTCYDEYDPIDNSFIYRNADETDTLPYIGDFAIYHGGGYTIVLGPKQSLVESYLTKLQNYSWIDGQTRAVFFESNTFNANTRLFTHLKIVFEISEYGSIMMKAVAESLNLYPYVTSMDYIVLVCQFIFILVVIVRLVFCIIHIFKTRRTCIRNLSSWITSIDVFLGISAIVFYILRVDTTIKTIDDIIESRRMYSKFLLKYMR
ncbi:polycystin-2-like protein 1 [Crassostrea virginica]